MFFVDRSSCHFSRGFTMSNLSWNQEKDNYGFLKRNTIQPYLVPERFIQLHFVLDIIPRYICSKTALNNFRFSVLSSSILLNIQYAAIFV